MLAIEKDMNEECELIQSIKEILDNWIKQSSESFTLTKEDEIYVAKYKNGKIDLYTEFTAIEVYSEIRNNSGKMVASLISEFIKHRFIKELVQL